MAEYNIPCKTTKLQNLFTVGSQALPLQKKKICYYYVESHFLGWILLKITIVALPKPGNNSGQDFVGAATCCIVLQRLLASRPCFEAIRNMPDVVAVIFQVKKAI